MVHFQLPSAPRFRRVLALGSHSDDIEIGCGATLLALTRARPEVEVTWVVLGAEGEREHEAHASAKAFTTAASRSEIVVHGFRDGFFPYVGGEVKDVFEELKRPTRPRPDSHACKARPAPGSPTRLRAHLEHVA